MEAIEFSMALAPVVWVGRKASPFRPPDNARLKAMTKYGRFIPELPRFICVGETAVLPNQRPPFGCCLLIWQRGDFG